MTSPFSAGRLIELHWTERRSLQAIAEIASSIVSEPVSAEQVAVWVREAGVDAWRGAAITQRIATTADAARSLAPIAPGQIVRRCEICSHDWPLAAFVRGRDICRNCEAVTRERVPGAHTGRSPKAAVNGRFECYVCKEWFEPALMVAAEPGRSPKICLACQRDKNKAYYERNREKLIAASLARKRG